MRNEPRTIKPVAYLLLGVGLFLVKFLIDRLVARTFGRDWSFMSYLIPSETYSLWSLPAQERGFYLVMLAVALPFVVVGLLLTWWRLRDAGLPRWLVVVFFIPAVNLVLFTLLGFWPSRRAQEAGGELPLADVAGTRALPARVPAPATFLIAALAGAIISSLSVVLAVLLMGNYGWGAFVAAPFVCGMSAGWIDGLARPRGAGESLAVAAVSMTLAGGAMVVAAFEGVACLIMAAPLAYPLALVGGLLGHALAMERHRRAGMLGRGFEVLPALCAPLLISVGEAVSPARPTLHPVTTSIIVDAPAEVVWQHVIRFPDLPRPRHWLFSSGIAYPVRARIDGTGPGATRYCEFSTGAFVEPITVWRPPGAVTTGLLRFDVTKCPPPLQEWSWRSIDPPHLDDFLISRQGQFEITPLPGGRTRLEGTTWYEHTIWPDAYWRLWSDWIIGRIHVEVLEHVKQLAEEP